MAGAFADRAEFARKTLQRKADKQVVVADDHYFSGLDAYHKLTASP